MSKITEQLPSVPDYFMMYVDSKIDLNTQKSIACPFHGETKGKSFSYSPTLGIWRCWGACHCGGDVIDLHKLNYRLRTREEAEKSLCAICGIELKLDLSFERETPTVDAKVVYRNRLYALANSIAKDPDAWIELDYIMSKAPFDEKELEVFCAKHGFPVQQSTNL